MATRQDVKKILMIGAGAVKIGGTGVLDFMTASAAKELEALGYEVVLQNPDAQALSNAPGTCGAIYSEPLCAENTKKIIEKERPDAILPIFGGKQAMALCHSLAASGVLSEYSVRQAGVSLYAMECCEDPVKFKTIMDMLGITTNEGIVVHTLEEAERAAEGFGYHVVIRSPYSTRSSVNSLVFNKEDLKRFTEPVLSSGSAALISKALIEYNEYEFEVIRDSKNNIMTLSSVENINPLDVHSSDSAVVTPAVTVSSEDYKKLEAAAFRIAEALQIAGIVDVRFAKNPKTGEWVVIRVTTSVSKLSGFTADAKGLELAKIAAAVALGEELSNIPALADYSEKRDFYTVRVPLFPFEAFPDAVDILDTRTRSVGTAEGVGKTFGEALQKALRAGGTYGLGTACDMSRRELLSRLITPSCKDLYYIYEALRRGASVSEISRITCIDEYFIGQIQELLLTENRLLKYRTQVPTEPVLMRAVRAGFSEKYISTLLSIDEETVRGAICDEEPQKNVIKIGKNRFVLTYNSAEPAESLGGRTALIVGGGANKIGSSTELRYAATMSARALKKAGYSVIYINPTGISDDEFDRVYLEAACAEDVLAVCRIENPEIILTQSAGDMAEEITAALESCGFCAAGADSAAYSRLSDKAKFRAICEALKIPSPRAESATDIDEALALAESIGYPVWVSGALSTTGKTVYASGELLNYLEQSGISAENPVRVENFLFSAVECEVDAVFFEEKVFIPEIMEHIESAGINSGDSACVIPPRSITDQNRETIYSYARLLASELKISGNINMRFAVDRDKLYLMGAQIGPSRTLPFVSKMCDTDLAGIGALSSAGEFSGNLTECKPTLFGVKEVVFPWEVFDECDPILGPDMRSTGSVMSAAPTFAEAFASAQEAAGAALPMGKNVYINLNERDNAQLLGLCREFTSAGFGILTTPEHKKELEAHGIATEAVKGLDGGRPNIGDAIINGMVDIAVNTAPGDSSIRRLVIKNSVAYMTTVSAAYAAAAGIKAKKDRTK